MTQIKKIKHTHTIRTSPARTSVSDEELTIHTVVKLTCTFLYTQLSAGVTSAHESGFSHSKRQTLLKCVLVSDRSVGMLHSDPLT